MAIVDASGDVENGYTYDVYGEPTVTGSLGNEFDFAGQQTDPSTGLQYLRARYYDSVSGTFLSRDPLEDAGGTGSSGYAYAAGRVANTSDPAGLAPWNRPEAGWCAKHPAWWGKCAQGAFWAVYADRETNALYGAESDEADAFRHCFWSACMTWAMGSKTAKDLTDLHERLDTAAELQESRKDLWNNAIGRLVGNRAVEIGPEYPSLNYIRSQCAYLAATGGLVINPNDATSFPDERAILPHFRTVGGGSW